MGRSSRQKINKEAVAWHETLGQMKFDRFVQNIPSKSKRKKKEKKKQKQKQKNARSSQVHMELPQK